MNADQQPLVGRRATPTPSNAGRISLGTILQLKTDPIVQGTKWVHCLGTPHLRRSLEEAGIAVWPAVPGLATEALDLVPVQAIVIEKAALERGPWTGALGNIAPDLAEQIVFLFERWTQLKVPMYFLTTTPIDQETNELLSNVLPVDIPEFRLVAPGSPLFVGDPEGAPPTRLLHCLRQHLAAAGLGPAKLSGGRKYVPPVNSS